MTQLTLFQTPDPERSTRSVRRIRDFSTFGLASEFAVEEKVTGKYDDVYLTKGPEGSTTRVVLMERVE
jgi:hypothetical protein